ncbi:hypothetical protein H072_6402 [Dactylellina haptotyla CBS 200.50]|uniref:Chitin-binding type-4 domain-containing protein n=1 Tax=Dactylellina haptotyla (strain CBS 200.50) TaxID=1284197 RepID=S8BKQ6_DACHA|nr:hypothetical protein H072_6402 [Dactylellina haptotyla CBS 200.50]
MQFSTSLIAAAAAFLPLINAHVALLSPPPYAGTTDNSPLDASGSNFPCKFPGGVGTKVAPAATDIFTPGQSGAFKLIGSAVHGGGSCQISITYDNPPTKNSVFKVVQSYEGACPVNADGNLPGADPSNGLPEIAVMLPDGLKAGEAVFVWTWFNRIGNREMYMNCAPITIGGSGSSDDVFNALPDMFVANINGAPNNACTTKETFDIVFPNPGANVVVQDTGHFAAACEGGPSTPGGSGSSPVVSSSAVAAPSTTSAPPSVVTAPALVGGPGVEISTGIIGSSFTDIGAPSSEAPSPTTMMTISTTMAASPVQPTTSSTTEEPAPVATEPSTGGSNASGTFVVGPCDATKNSIMCGSDLTTYTQCFDNNMAYGPFKVPPGTECDSTGMGSFKATKPASSRMLKRFLGRGHRRSFVHSHSF